MAVKITLAAGLDPRNRQTEPDHPLAVERAERLAADLRRGDEQPHRQQFDFLESPDDLSADCTASANSSCVRSARISIMAFRVLPKRFHFLDGRFRGVLPLRGQTLFDVREAAAELRVGLAQRLFRIHFQEPRDDSRSRTADRRARPPPRSCFRALRATPRAPRPACRTPGPMFSQSNPAPAAREAICCASTNAGSERGTPSSSPFGPRLLFSLDLVPAPLDVVGGPRIAIAEHMRMPADQFAVDRLQRIRDIEAAVFGRHLREEHRLQQQIAQFFRQPLPIPRVDRVHHFVGFFEQVRLDGVEVLFAIPRAAAGRAQPRHDLDQPRERGSSRQFGLSVGHEEISD